jgi:hypothetical protein
VIVSLFVGLAVLVASSAAAYRLFRGSGVQIRQRLTLYDIQQAEEAIEAYRQRTQGLPESLRDVASEVARLDEDGMPTDRWGRPLDYWTDGASYRITSCGGDGEPGGVGLDCDLSSDDLRRQRGAPSAWSALPEGTVPTFRQFVTDKNECPTGGSGRTMFAACLLTAPIAVVLSLQVLGATMPGRRPIRARIERIVIAAGATLFVALFLALLHAP